jgi:hypothetical protein
MAILIKSTPFAGILPEIASKIPKLAGQGNDWPITEARVGERSILP